MQMVLIHTVDGFSSAILGDPGRIYTPYIAMDFPIRLQRIANGDVARFTTPLLLKDKPYPIKRAAGHMLRVGRTQHGKITKGARKLLMEAKQCHR